LNNSSTNPKKASDPDANIVNALLSYMHDCGFDESHLTPMFLALTLEYVYQPHPRFWRDFNVTILIDALSRHMPNWRTTAGMRKGGADWLSQQVEMILRFNALDEANGEMILALPVEERPMTPSSAFAWISAELAKKGLAAQLEFARPDGERCGKNALDAVYCLEQAKLGNAVERTGTIVAKAYRDAVMKRRSQREVSARQAVSAAGV
jgi:hypothetical protein